jgi:hypothetical protein
MDGLLPILFACRAEHVREHGVLGVVDDAMLDANASGCRWSEEISAVAACPIS